MRIWKYTFGLLFLVAAIIGIALSQLPDSNLHLVACDVGQGDAILAIYGNIQILTDGGVANGKVLNCISRHMPFWDREIEGIFLTHPQLDHYGGLTEVFKKYKVDNFFANPLDSSSNEYQALKKEVGSRGVKVITPQTGMKAKWGSMYLDIFWPSRQFLIDQGWNDEEGKLGTFLSKRDPNDFSVQAILSLGDFDALLTGDIGHNMADEVLQNFVVSASRTIEYIKVPHHGSKYGLTPDYLNVIAPKVAVISVGKNNRYGHPHQEILQMLNKQMTQILRTDERGDIEVITDGKKWWIR